MENMMHLMCLAVVVTLGSTGIDVAGALWIMADKIPTDGVVFAYSAYFHSDKPVRFQIWRPIYIARQSREKCLLVRAGDRVGVYIEEAPGAVAYTFDPTPPYLLGGVFESIVSNQTVSFKSTLPFPYALSFSVYLDTNMTLYGITGDPYPDCPKRLTIPYVTKVIARERSGRRVPRHTHTGREMARVWLSVLVFVFLLELCSAGTYLLDDRVLTDGVVFAYSAYFISNKPVRFQVWRPVVNGTENVYRLVGQTRVRPSQTYSREDIYLENMPTGKCVRVRIGDKVGIFVEASMKFAAIMKTYPPYHLKHEHWRPAAINEGVVFDSYVFPFVLIMRAYIDIKTSAYGRPIRRRATKAPVIIPSSAAIVQTTTSSKLTIITAGNVCGFVLLVAIVAVLKDFSEGARQYGITHSHRPTSCGEEDTSHAPQSECETIAAFPPDHEGYIDFMPFGTTGETTENKRKCVRVRIGDKVGIFVEASMKFAAIMKTYPLYHLKHQHWRPAAINEGVVFDSYVFPFVLIMRAYIDIKTSAYGNAGDPFPNCPKGLGINGVTEAFSEDGTQHNIIHGHR
ncbi:hypothetical protein NP493_789g00026 [Ridgeia piscesae]|uniref:Uncharacterized protein n=1 Tax=Ridgeia piscesae TaxID=27915 RepID=A0AAD9KNU3_RIDPI|nr:hypothetical protein NP493_789g00026 [Ridgeia piscesae]